MTAVLPTRCRARLPEGQPRGWPGDPWPAREVPPPAPARPPEKPGFSFHDLFPLFGIFFVVVGLGMLCSPLWMIYKARTSAYLVARRA